MYTHHKYEQTPAGNRILKPITCTSQDMSTAVSMHTLSFVTIIIWRCLSTSHVQEFVCTLWNTSCTALHRRCDDWCKAHRFESAHGGASWVHSDNVLDLAQRLLFLTSSFAFGYLWAAAGNKRQVNVDTHTICSLASRVSHFDRSHCLTQCQSMMVERFSSRCFYRVQFQKLKKK